MRTTVVTSNRHRFGLKHKFLVAFLIFIFLVLPAIPFHPALAAPSSSHTSVDPPPTVLIANSTIPTMISGSTVVVVVNVTNFPLFSSFDVQVKADSGALTLTGSSLSFANSVLTAGTDTQLVNCVNGGAGITLNHPGNIGCKSWDGNGIAHLAVSSSAFASGAGEIFSVTYTASSAASTPIDLYNDTMGNGTPTPVAHVTVSGVYGTAQPDFLIQSSPLTQTIPQGTSGMVQIKVTSLNTFAATVALTDLLIPSTPIPPTVFLSSNSVSLTSGSSQNVTLTITASNTATVDPYAVLVSGSAPWPACSGCVLTSPLAHPVWNGANVVAPSFTLTAHPPTLNDLLGFSVSENVTVATQNMAATVALAVNVRDSSNVVTTAVQASLNVSSLVLPSNGSHNITLTITSTSTTPSGTYVVRVNGTATVLGLSKTKSAVVNLQVSPFDGSASPASFSLVRHENATSTITIHNIATFGIDVTLFDLISPLVNIPPTVTYTNSSCTRCSEVAVYLAPGAVASVTMVINTTANRNNPTVVNSYTLTVTGTIGSTIFNSATVSLAVATTGFSMSPASSDASINVGASASDVMTVTRIGQFNGTLSFGVSSLPSGITGSCPSITVPTTLTSSCSFTSSTPGSYAVTVTATNSTTNSSGKPIRGSPSHSLSLIVHIGDLQISAISPINFDSGSPGSSTVTLTSLNNFAGSVDLTTLPNSTSLTVTGCTNNPASMVANGTVQPVCSFSSSTVGNYNVSITATASTGFGTASHQTFVIVHVFPAGFVDFSITAASGEVSFNSGTSMSDVMTLSPLGSFHGTVNFGVSSMPSGVIGSCPTIVVPATSTSSCSFMSSSPGFYAATVTATNSTGTPTHTLTIFVHVGDFSIKSVSSVDVSFNTGSSGSVTLNLTSIQNWAGTVNVGGSTSGLTVSCPSAMLLANGTGVQSDCMISSSTAGFYSVTLAASAAASFGTASHSVTIFVHVGDFSITSVSGASFNTGSSGSVTVNLLSAQSWAGTVNVGGSTSGLTVSCSSASLVANLTGSSDCMISSSTPGLYSFTLTASAAASFGTASHSATIFVHVGDFSISSVSPTPVTAGSPATGTINLASVQNFADNVALSDTPLPSGISCGVFSQGSVTLAANATNSATLTCNSPGGGTFTVTITATANTGTASHSTTLTMTFTIVGLPTTSSVGVVVGGTNSTTVNIGQTAVIVVSVTNAGTTPANFTISVNWGSLTVSKQTVTGLAPGASHSYNLLWDTTNYGSGTNTLSVVLQGTTYSGATFTRTYTNGPNVTLTTTSNPLSGYLIPIIAAVAVAAVVSVILILRRRRAHPATSI